MSGFNPGDLIFSRYEGWWGILLDSHSSEMLDLAGPGYSFGDVLVFDSFSQFIGRVITPVLLRDPIIAFAAEDETTPGYIPIEFIFDEKGNYLEKI